MTFHDRHLTRRLLLQSRRTGDGRQRKGSRPARRCARSPRALLHPAGRFSGCLARQASPHSLPEEKKREVGLLRETWRLKVLSDPDNPAALSQELTLDFQTLLKMGEKRAVRFPKVMSCLNLDTPLGMGIWEGVPLRDVVWLTQPRENLRRVFYYGYHNDDPAQMFRSSLAIGRVLEDPFDLPPVILCYKLNGQWLDSHRGGPVRVVVPEAYGFKCIKWLTHLLLSNLPHANDTYAEQNNDVDSPLKTYAAADSDPPPGQTRPADPGFGICPGRNLRALKSTGLDRIGRQARASRRSLFPNRRPGWKAKILGPRNLGKIPDQTLGFKAGTPVTWPLRLTKAEWSPSCPASPPAGTPSAADPSMIKASLSPCPGPSANPDTPRSIRWRLPSRRDSLAMQRRIDHRRHRRHVQIGFQKPRHQNRDHRRIGKEIAMVQKQRLAALGRRQNLPRPQQLPSKR